MVSEKKLASGRKPLGSNSQDYNVDDDLELPDLQAYSIWGSDFHIPKKYTLVDAIGQGAYGIVIFATEKSGSIASASPDGSAPMTAAGTHLPEETDGEEEPSKVAIKKIENVFDCLTLAKRTLRELRIIRHMSHENVMGLLTTFVSEPKAVFDDVYLVCEHMETDLSTILKSGQHLDDGHHQFWIYQLLRGMKYVHSADVAHRDLKPRNILVCANCDLKICDFGLARVCFDVGGEDYLLSPLTDYICTRWYRGPELLTGTEIRDLKKLDVWSMGCIFAEMLGRRPLFPGTNSQHQFALIIAYTGWPSAEDLARIGSTKVHKFLRSLPRTEPKSYQAALPQAKKVAVDLVRLLLRFTPCDRPTVEKALQHPYLKGLYCEEDEPTTVPMRREDFEFERRKATMNTMREEIWREILEHYPEKKKEYLKRSRYSILDVGLKPRTISSYDALDSDDSGAIEIR